MRLWDTMLCGITILQEEEMESWVSSKIPTRFIHYETYTWLLSSMRLWSKGLEG